MSFFDDFLGSIPVVGSLAEGIFGGNAGGGDTRQQAIQAYQSLMGQLPGYNPLNTRDVINASAGPANDMARAREGSAMQQEMMHSGGNASSGNVLAAKELGSQGSMNRLAQVGYQANVENWAAVNRFNQQNIMNKLAITHGMTGQMDNMADYQDRQSDQRRQGLSNMWNFFGNAFGKSGGGGGGGGGLSVDSAWNNINDAGGLPGFPGMGI